MTRPDSGVQACEREVMVDVTLAFEDDKHGVAGRCDEVGKVVEVSDILKLSSATGQSEVMLGSNTDKKKDLKQLQRKKHKTFLERVCANFG